VVFALTIAAYHLWWLVRFRDGQPVDIDEAGYLAIGLNDLAALRDGGVSGLWDSVQAQTPHAPLVPLLAVPALAIRAGVVSAFAVELAAMVVLAAATFGMARRLVNDRWAFVAMLTVLAAPGVLRYSREFSFALPCTAALAVAFWALLRSDGMTRRRWAVLAGVAAGCAVLSRTMTIGFLPGLGVAMLIVASTATGRRRRALLNVVVAAVAGVAVAALWYWRNLGPVLDYLSGYGYGEQAAEYGESIPITSPDWWLDELRAATVQLLFAPLLLTTAAVLGAGLVACVVGFPRSRGGVRDLATRFWRHPTFPMLVFLGAGYLALSSTANSGSAFSMPLLPAFVVLVVAIAARLPWRVMRVAAAGALVGVAAFQLLVYAQVVGTLERSRVVELPLVRSAPTTNAQVPVFGGLGAPYTQTRFRETDKRWRERIERIAQLSTDHAAANGRLPVVAFATRDRLFNPNTLNLITLLAGRPGIPVAQLTTDEGDTAAAYAQALSDPARGQPNILVTADTERGDFEPQVTQAVAVRAAKQLDFRPFAYVRQSNGERLTLWWFPRGPSIPSAPVGGGDASR
jgi:4-amino-4-deoxy-L-arabinose transferase-like glycosyltransferase